MIISLQKFSKLQLLFFHQLIFLFFLPIFQCLQFVQQKTRVFQVTCNLDPVQDLNLRLNIETKVLRLQLNQCSDQNYVLIFLSLIRIIERDEKNWCIFWRSSTYFKNQSYL